jgi:hypothetical protein
VVDDGIAVGEGAIVTAFLPNIRLPDEETLDLRLSLLPVALVSCALLFAQPLHVRRACERWFYIRGWMKHFVVLVDTLFRAPIIAPATLSDVGYGLISQWLCDAARFSTSSQDNGILGVADDVIEA